MQKFCIPTAFVLVLAFTLLAMAASSVHFLARLHIFTTLYRDATTVV